MANVKAYSSKQFSFLIAMQDDMGTLEPGGGNPYLAVDVDSIGTPSLNLTQVLEPRSGSRVLQATDFGVERPRVPYYIGDCIMTVSYTHLTLPTTPYV